MKKSTHAKARRAMWQFPWQYKESAVFVAGLILVGFLLQVSAGPVDFFLLHYPVNLVCAALLLCLLLSGFFFGKNRAVLWLSGIPMSVCLITGLLIFSLIMGLTPQMARVDPHDHGPFGALGFRNITVSWAFVLVYAMTLLSLSMLIGRRLRFFRFRDLPFYCNHVGLWLFLLSAGLGAADMRRFVMHVLEGDVEWRVYSENNDVLELPIAIKLKDFIMEEYPPKLAIIDRATGAPQPEGKPSFLPLERPDEVAALLEWDIAVEQYIHEAVKDAGGFHHSPMPASTPAALVTAKNRRTGEAHTGWISSGGNIPGFFSALNLDENHVLVMSTPEPKRFASDITVLTKEGLERDYMLEVNAPLSVGWWTIYQYSYDGNAGKMSPYSSFELVYDPWLAPAYAGMVLMILGALGLVWQGNGRRRKNDLA